MEKARILVVEDEAIVAMDIADTLRNIGHEVTDSVPSGKQAIASVKKNSSNKKHYERKDSKGGQYYFVLKAANSKVIGKSQMYKSHESSENGIESIKTNARQAKIYFQ